MTNINIHDDSGDKEFFTIIPNYITNHSTANDQALYLQMKKHAGENGRCFATEKTMMKKLGIGKKSYDKSLNYLIKRGWITYVGMTRGKTRPIKTYKVNNIWKINNEHYNKIGSESTLSKDKSQKKGDKSQKQHKISSESNVEEEPVLTRTNNNITYVDEQQKGVIDSLINKFRDVNPSYKKLFSNKTERAAMERMVKEHGEDKVSQIIDVLPQTNQEKYAPVISTPYQLENKMGNLIAFLKREKGQSKFINLDE